MYSFNWGCLFICKGDQIGSGNFSKVFNGHIKNDKGIRKVAWKIPNLKNDEDKEALLKELKTLSTPALLHDNICQMLMHVNIEGKNINYFTTFECK